MGKNNKKKMLIEESHELKLGGWQIPSTYMLDMIKQKLSCFNELFVLLCSTTVSRIRFIGSICFCDGRNNHCITIVALLQRSVKTCQK